MDGHPRRRGYPDVNIRRDATPLIRNLRHSGMIRAFENKDVANPHLGYRPGAIDMAPDSQFVIDDNGRVNEDIAIVGIPSENNFVGNKTLAPGRYPSRWARRTIAQLLHVSPCSGAGA